MKSISIFSPIKNEVDNIGYHCMAFYPYVKKFVWADGGSVDGTVELLKYIKEKYDTENKITLHENTDCNIYDHTYTDLYNRLLEDCKDTEIVSYIHPDMIPINPEVLEHLGESEDLRYFGSMLSFVRDREHVWSDNQSRSNKWILFNKNDFGLHYYGYYGDIHEDLYYKEITGDEHVLWMLKTASLPYSIGDSGLVLFHYCDAKPYKRRLEKMVSVLHNHRPQIDMQEIERESKMHPRVTAESGWWKDIYGKKIDFVVNDYVGKQPEIFEKYKEFEQFKTGK